MKKIAMLLNGEIINDYRVIKIIKTLSTIAVVDLFYINGNLKEDSKLFNANANVNLISMNHKTTFWVSFLRHTFFCFEFNFFINVVLSRKQKYDFIWSNDLPTLSPAYKLSEKLNSKLVYDSHEIYIETLNQFFPNRPIFMKRIIFNFFLFFMKWHGNFIEKKCIQKVSLFITVNKSILDYFNKKYSFSKGLVIMNLPQKNYYKLSMVDYRGIYKWQESDFIVLYQGGLNEGRGLFLLIDAFKELDTSYKLIVLGDGSLKNELVRKVNKDNLLNQVKFINTVPLIDLPNYTIGADIGVNLLEDFNLSKKMASPNKLFEYIHAEIPVLASDTLENNLVFQKYNIGLITINASKSIASSIKTLSKSDFSHYKSNCCIAKDFYCWENQEQKLLESIR
jgi:glycosyltransferase involved in cell wall biosynthesis